MLANGAALASLIGRLYSYSSPPKNCIKDKRGSMLLSDAGFGDVAEKGGWFMYLNK